MLSVTESVMEDQKVLLSNAITEMTNKNMILQDEIIAIKEQSLTEKTKLDIEIQEKLLSLETVQKELVELKIQKQLIDKENKAMDKEVLSLKTAIQMKENEITKANEEHRALQALMEEKVTSLLADVNNKENKIEAVLSEKDAFKDIIRNYEECKYNYDT